jgi:hypothetical protein
VVWGAYKVQDKPGEFPFSFYLFILVVYMIHQVSERRVPQFPFSLNLFIPFVNMLE